MVLGLSSNLTVLVLYCLQQNLISSVSNIITMNLHVLDMLQPAEWEQLNRLLQQRGFRPVLFADPVESKSPAELGLLDRKSAAALRWTLETLLAYHDRRRALLQELVGSNNRLREEVQEQMSHACQHSQKASELQVLLDQVKVQVQDLEDGCICRPTAARCSWSATGPRPQSVPALTLKDDHLLMKAFILKCNLCVCAAVPQTDFKIRDRNHLLKKTILFS
ncbi:centrosomal protein of 70 kDa-like [Oryzias melastigma]|uniref:centrosomal protein of 70 kDa-like n=1 Tax=Oryzias melastigma TaxID=30732 RepID=UPI00168D7545|nr:centrosomal protein of 70 kDa-like [Oryzias melastigma]